MKNELINTLICILLIAIVFTPCINAENENTDSPSIQYDELEKKIEELENKISPANSEEENTAILREMAILYDEYRLIPNMTVDEMEQLLINGYTSQYNIHAKEQQEQRYAPGELMVKFKVEINMSISNGIITTGLESIDKLNMDFGIISAEKLFGNNPPSSLSNVYKFIFSSGTDILHIMKQYSSDPNVEYAELNYIYQAFANQDPTEFVLKDLKFVGPTSNPVLIPNDPLFNQQWALNQSNDCDIDAPEAWHVETGTSNVTIAIIDTGVDYNHPDLHNNMLYYPNGTVHGYDFVNNDNDPMDDNGHGTFCTGIAAAVTNNSVGIAGVCWNCKIMPIKCLDNGGGAYEDDLANGIYYAVINGADVISMSWGFYYLFFATGKLFYDAVTYAYSQGVVLIAAAGNDNVDSRTYPASIDHVIAVAATDSSDAKASFSNYGSWIDVAAPGVDILSTRLGDGYETGSGTSAACPYVVGLAALLLSKYPQCPCPAQMVDSVIRYTTDEIETDEYIGTGRINAHKALTMEPFAVDLDAVPNWEDIKGTIELKGTAWGDDFLYFTLEIGESENPSSWTELANSSVPQSGVLFSLDTTGLDETVYTIRLQVVYSHGVYTDKKIIHVNNEADGSYNADIYVSNCYDSSTPGWGATHFGKIQDGINKASSGDTIFVFDGIYPEDITIKGLLKSSISLVGQSKEWAIVEGSVNISNTRKISVNDFTIRGGLGFFINENSQYEILLSFCSKCTITDCNIVNYYNIAALSIMFSSDNIIRNNNITGFYTSRSPAIMTFLSSNLEISGNTMSHHGVGVGMVGGHSNVIKNNIYTYAGDCNWYIFSHNNLIYKNTIIHSDIGVDLWGGCYCNIVTANSFIDNGLGFLGWPAQAGNHFYLNNFIESPTIDDGINLWYKSEGLFKGKGNYWSIYEQWYNDKYGEDPKDENNDGIWDKPFDIPNSNKKITTKDQFPFVEPIDIENITTSEAEAFISQILNKFNSDLSEVEINSQQSNPQDNPASQNRQSSPSVQQSAQLLQNIIIRQQMTNR